MILGEHNMRKNNLMKRLSLMLCMVFIAAMTLMTACSDNKANDEPTTTVADNNEKESPDNVTVLGEGKVSFAFTVVDGAGNETKYTINTDKKTVGDALLEHKLIEGENGDYGLYVKKVNGITADYDVDKTYWAFYINGEYAMTGVDATDVIEGATYMFKVEK